ncbi:hypothetical protein BJ878DRAFT_127470 [Calycina marina]|uniref:GDP/GTP exchange factor Sec2 N-terminal domain-containing protein n=1 Tax=Calycina marina TaxID=1763456 RepID=A0A9P7Z0Z7_9HELO|nr:hypothetical protein BJ878DRAFT_127470 [Calycina marina]
MSTTMTLPMMVDNAPHACPNCGISLPSSFYPKSGPHQQIQDLQAQMQLLTQKAQSAVDRSAGYEDEIQQLKAHKEGERRDSAIGSIPFDERSSSPSRPTSNIGNRLSYFLSARKSTANLKPQSPTSPLPPPISTQGELEEQLNIERGRRKKAESQLVDASGELEDLTVKLFEQANEMVASERKARAKLEERIAVLEKRDEEKRKRLERLDGAMARIERVRSLLGPETWERFDG